MSDDKFRRLFERMARRYHEFANIQQAVEHRHWKWENCPAEVCTEARRELGMLSNAIGFARPERQPGQEG